MSGSLRDWPHFEKTHLGTRPRRLPRSFNSRETTPDYVDYAHTVLQRRLEAGVARRLNVEPVGNAHLLNNKQSPGSFSPEGGQAANTYGLLIAGPSVFGASFFAGSVFGASSL
jgi:hypothetical protein